MTGPANSVTTRDGARTYTWHGQKFPSVTTILNSWPKPWLGRWAAKVVAEAAVDMHRAGSMDDGATKDDLVKALKGAPWDVRDGAAETGTAVHRAIELAILHEDQAGYQPDAGLVEEGARHRWREFQRFTRDHAPVWEQSEATVYNRRERYAGTLDAIAVIGGRRLLIDIKTGKSVYSEFPLQLAAYARGEFVGVKGAGGGFGDMEHEMPVVDGGAVLHLPAKGPYRLVEVDISPRVFQAFLVVRDLHEWINGGGKHAVLDTIQPHTTESDEALFRRLSGEAA